MKQEFNRPVAQLHDVQVALADGEHWGSFAECRQADPELFRPREQNERGYKQRIKEVQAICGRCLVRNQCLLQTFELEDFGAFRAGLEPKQLEDLFNLRQAQEKRRLADTSQHEPLAS